MDTAAARFSPPETAGSSSPFPRSGGADDQQRPAKRLLRVRRPFLGARFPQNAARQRLVYGTPIGNLEQPFSHFVRERPEQGDLSLDMGDSDEVRRAILAVRYVGPRLTHAYLYPFQWQPLPIGVPSQRHGGTASQSAEHT